MTPGLGHALLALAMQAAIAAPLLLLHPPETAFSIGAACAVSFYVGRERRQSEEHYGSNRIPPWRWKPRALRDIAWPALAVAIVAVGVAAL